MSQAYVVGIGASGAITVPDGGTGRGTLTDGAFILGNGVAAVTMLGPGSNGQLPIGSTGADPVLATLTAGPGISITNGAGSIQISNTAGGFDWTDVTGTSQSMAVQSGYLSNNAALVTLTLPTTAAQFSQIQIAGYGAGGWKIAQNAGQVIHFNSTSTTIGVTGFISSTNRYNTIELLCVVADTTWVVLDSSGTFTVN